MLTGGVIGRDGCFFSVAGDGKGDGSRERCESVLKLLVLRRREDLGFKSAESNELMDLRKPLELLVGLFFGEVPAGVFSMAKGRTYSLLISEKTRGPALTGENEGVGWTVSDLGRIGVGDSPGSG